MKYAALVLALLCGSAHATNVFYYPIMDQDTGLPNVLYFTDESSGKCPNNMMVARLETDDKKVLNTLCWARDRNNMGNTLLLNLSNGQITSNDIPYGVSKYAGDAYPTLMKKWLAENEAAIKVMNSYEFMKRRGLLSQQEIEAGQAAYEQDQARTEARHKEIEAQAKVKYVQDQAAAEVRLATLKAEAAKWKADCASSGLACP